MKKILLCCAVAASAILVTSAPVSAQGAESCDKLWVGFKGNVSALKKEIKKCVKGHNKVAPKTKKIPVCDKACLEKCDMVALKKGKGKPSAVKEHLAKCIVKG